MSSSEKQITCRGCDESIPADADNCPHCGTGVRSNTGPIIAVVFGAILFAAAIADLVLNQETRILIYGVVGLVVAAIGGYVIYEKRQRISEATAHDHA
ncbi:MAG: zinc ribbon domain-containing protein [Halobacteriaceae archaeon]